MPIMKQKSDENLNAARLLVENNMYASSIHCFYYSILQLSKYILDKYCGISYEQQDENFQGKDSHNAIIKILGQKLGAKNRFYKLDYMSNLNNLKKLRKTADYSNNQILSNDIGCATNDVKELLNILHKNYKL